jgi:hypothetical protein
MSAAVQKLPFGGRLKIKGNQPRRFLLRKTLMPHSTDIFADCKYLYLDRLFEPFENRLSIRVFEATGGGSVSSAVIEAEQLAPLKEILMKASTIEHRAGCRIFEITWPSYIGYSVRNESFAIAEPENPIGFSRLFCEYTSSTYLSYLGQASWACNDHPGPYRHWK